MTIGDKIKIIREFRGMTQKELGIELGFSPKTAQIRVAHYETGFRVPKKDIVIKLCDALNIHPFTLGTDYESEFVHLMETLFWTEEEMQGRMHIALAELDPKMKCADDEMEVRYGTGEEWKNLYPAMIWFEDTTISMYFKDWALKKRELAKGKITQEQYFEWKLQWPGDSYVSSFYAGSQILTKKVP